MFNSTYQSYFAIGALSFAVSFLTIPLILKLSRKYNLYDRINSRKIHIKKTSRLGGVAVFLAFFPIAAYLAMKQEAVYNGYLFIAAMCIAFLSGIIDDIVKLKAYHKLIIQIIAASLVVFSGLLIVDLRVYTFLHIEFGVLSYLVTIIWIVAFMNAVNLIDGMDGLSTGIVLIANFFVIIIAIMSGNHKALGLAVALEFAILGFYLYNFPPARIFLGDGGAYFIGFVYAVMPLLGIKKSAALTVFLIPMVLLLIPIYDTFNVIYARYKAKKNIFHPDKNHVHHRLMNLGLSNREILKIVYVYTASLGLFSLYMTIAKPHFTIPLLSFAFIIITVSFYAIGRAENRIARLKAEKRFVSTYHHKHEKAEKPETM